VYVTHDQAEAVVLGDRIAVMNQGRVVQLADPLSLYNRPASPFVAEFTGATNILQGRLDRLEDRAGVVRLEGDFEVRCRADGAPPGGECGDSRLATREPPGGAGGRPNTWSGRVVKAEFLGTHSIYRVQVGGHTLTAIELGSTPNFPDNASVSLHIPPERVSLMASTST
jgi:iron(III) transport system ATP-binding protein